MNYPAGSSDLVSKTAGQLLYESLCDGLKLDPELLVANWADEHRRLSSKSSAEPGPWRTARVPYMREIMNAMSPTHPCTDAAFMKGTQIAGSEGIYNVLGTYIDRAPCPIMLVMPTTETAKRTSRQRLQPMIDESPALSSRVREARSRDSGNTVLMKDFPGGFLVVAGANSGPGLRSMPVRVLMMDEVDAYPSDVGGEGDPCTVAEKRTDTFGTRAKRLSMSTPKLKGSSRIEGRYQRGTQAQFYVPCPHCMHEQPLRWEQMRWAMLTERELVCNACGVVSRLPDGIHEHAACPACAAQVTLTDATARPRPTDEIERVWYECEACREPIEEHHKRWMLERGRHIHHEPGAGMFLDDDDANPHAIWVKLDEQIKRFLPRFTRPLSWQVSGLYSPLGWFSWFKAVRQYLDAQKGGYDEETGESLDQVFWNTVCGLPFEVKGEQPQNSVLKLRAEPYELGTVPAGALLLTAAVDVQGNRLEVKVKGYGRGEESWLIDYQVLHGDPRRDEVWEQLAQYRERAFTRSSGATMRITAMAIDSGFRTQEVYAFCRKWRHKHVFATKGVQQPGRSILGRPSKQDISHLGKTIAKGVELWIVGVDAAKFMVYERLDLAEPGRGYMHFPAGLSDEYFEGLAAEKLVRKRTRGAESHEWVKTSERNEPLDLEILCYAAALYAGVSRVDWDQLERAIAQGDLFARDSAPRETNNPPESSTAAGPGEDGPAPPGASPANPPEPAASGLFVIRPPKRSGALIGA